MKLIILAYNLTPEVDCVLAWCKWHQIPFVINITPENLAHTKCSSIPCIKVSEPGKEQVTVNGFDALYAYVHKAGMCLI